MVGHKSFEGDGSNSSSVLLSEHTFISLAVLTFQRGARTWGCRGPRSRRPCRGPCSGLSRAPRTLHTASHNQQLLSQGPWRFLFYKSFNQNKLLNSINNNLSLSSYKIRRVFSPLYEEKSYKSKVLVFLHLWTTPCQINDLERVLFCNMPR